MPEIGQSGAVFDLEMYLVAVTEQVVPDEIRRYWNSKEAPALEALIGGSPRVRLGMTEAPYPGNENRRGPVGRVFDLLFLRGTTPDYCLPILDEALESKVLVAMEPRPHDPPFDTEPIDHILNFLREHRGSPVVIEELSPNTPGSRSAGGTLNFRLGFTLAEPKRLSWADQRAYRGLDRLPDVPFLSDLNDRDRTLWDQYLDALDDGDLAISLDRAASLRNGLATIGLDSEIIYAEVVAIPQTHVLDLSLADANLRDLTLDVLLARSGQIPSVPETYVLLGYDVCVPVPSFHSAIFQPGPVPHDAGQIEQLNVWGLLSSRSAAADWMDRANATGYMLSEFAAIAVFGLSP